jgi:hypothetical protein
MCTGYGCYRDQIVDEAVGVGYKVAWTDFDVQRDGALTQNVLERREKREPLKNREANFGGLAKR